MTGLCVSELQKLKKSKCNLYRYLEFLIQFFLYPVCNMSQSDFSFSQFRSCLQFQVRWLPKTIPATEKIKTINDLLTDTIKSSNTL